MKIPILIRLTLAMTALAVGVAAGVGYFAAEAAGQAVEQRLVYQLAENAAALVGEQNLPMTDALLRQLRRIVGAQIVALDAGGRVVASSLPAEERDSLADRLAEPNADRITLGSTAYRMGRHEVVRADPLGTAPLRVTLVVLAEPEQFEQARDRVTGRIRTIALVAAAAAVLLAVGLSLTITRPIRRLARRMDALARKAGGDRPPPGPAESSQPAAATAVAGRAASAGAATPERPGRGPTEVAHLERSFQHLLGSLQQAREQLARSERLATLGKVAASVAHELRNPLSGIVMNLRVLRDELAGTDVSREGLDLITAEAERMQLYLDELMSLARGPAGEQNADLSAAATHPSGPGEWPPPNEGEPEDGHAEAAALSDLADSVVTLLAGRFRHAGVTVATDYTPAPPARAQAGPVRQVLMNLLINALEAAPRGSTVCLTVRPADEGRVRCEIADQGPGVSDSAGDVFDALVTTKPDGAGLGLYVCRRIVADMGGRIGYDNADRGATFWFELPAALAPPAGPHSQDIA